MIANGMKKITAALLLLVMTGAPAAQADGYRGYGYAQPVYAQQGYPQQGYAQPVYARPVYAQPQVVAVPAYGRPTYYAAPQAPVVQTYRPVSGGYAQQTYYRGAAQPAYQYQSGYGVAPVAYTSSQPIAAYRPQTQGYAISTSGFGTPGAEASHLYGQPTPINYTPPQYYYRSTYAQVPVYAYRPVTVYQGAMAQPTTCLQPAPTTCLQPTTTSQCQQQRQRCGFFPWLSNLFCPKKSSCAPPPTACGYSGNCSVGYCPAPVASGCGQQPYYPATPVIPTQPGNVIPARPGFVPAPTTTYPAPAPGNIFSSPTVPPPPTRTPGGSFVPADSAPSLRGTTTNPGVAPPPAPPSSFPAPGTTFPAPGTGTNYPPVTDPYVQPSSGVTEPEFRSSVPTTQESSTGGSRGSSRYPSFGSGSPRSQATIRSQPAPSGPSLAPAHGNAPAGPSSPAIRTVPDPDATAPASGAPQLLDPRDQTALRDPRWQVVPAVYGRPSDTRSASMRQTMSYEVPASSSNVTIGVPTQSVATPAPAVDNTVWDDSGWKSARQ